jgi:hypothetical protein
MTVAYNIGYYTPSLGSVGIITPHPILREYENFSEFATEIRQQSEFIFNWSKEGHHIPSSIVFRVTVADHQFTIRLINVREYRELWEKRYSKKWTFDRDL